MTNFEGRKVEAGERYGSLLVTKTRYPGETLVACLCDCGTAVDVKFRLLGVKTNSCGCLKKGKNNSNWRGGTTSHPLYESYLDMIARCNRSTHHAFDRYGGRGVTVCTRWQKSFWNFVEDMGDRPEGHSLDRIDNDGPYAPSNCRWATASTQMKNRRESAYAGSVRDERTGRFLPGDPV
jgi:hypothetical protein